jgi:hypothetical protein
MEHEFWYEIWCRSKPVSCGGENTIHQEVRSILNEKEGGESRARENEISR